jgi:hypothetical protein
MSKYIIEELSCESKHFNKNREYSERDKDFIISEYNKTLSSIPKKEGIRAYNRLQKEIILEKFNDLSKQIEDFKYVLGVNIKYPWYYCNKCNGHTPRQMEHCDKCKNPNNVSIEYVSKSEYEILEKIQARKDLSYSGILECNKEECLKKDLYICRLCQHKVKRNFYHCDDCNSNKNTYFITICECCKI